MWILFLASYWGCEMLFNESLKDIVGYTRPNKRIFFKYRNALGKMGNKYQIKRNDLT